MLIDDLDLDTSDHGGARYRGELYSGFAATFHLGVVVMCAEYKNGIEHGITREWYPDGDLAYECFRYWYQNHGFLREWHRPGVLAQCVVYEYGFSRWKTVWDTDGRVISDAAVVHRPDLERSITSAHGLRIAEGWPPIEVWMASSIARLDIALADLPPERKPFKTA